MECKREVVEHGVDYITATCLPKDGRQWGQLESFARLGSDLVQAEARRGNDRRPFRLQSFVGSTAGRATFGFYEDGAVIRLSGGLARGEWLNVYRDSTNVSRLDTQVTVRLPDEWEDLSKTHLYEVRDFAKKSMPKLKTRRIDGGKDGNALYIGSRTSERFIRIYDKGAESRDAAYNRCWRYEVEFKKSEANREAALLDSIPLPGTLGVGSLPELLRARGIRSEFLIVERNNSVGRERATDDQKRLDWLRAACSRSVELLVSHGRLDDVLDALGLSATVRRVSNINGDEDER